MNGLRNIDRIRFTKNAVAIGLLASLSLVGSAQPRPSLGAQIFGGQPTLSLTGEVGTVYSIQYTAGLSSTNLWVDRTLLQATGAGIVWSDPSAPSTGQHFYRAVSVTAPADTNLLFIQPGTFMMGSPTNEVGRTEVRPPTAVTVSSGFWMGKYEVTQSEYLAVMGTNPSGFTGDNNPVETVDWSDAMDYCGTLTQRERAAGRIATNSVYRLPTEPEWEYACRAGTSTRFSYGDDPGYTKLTNYAWYGANSDDMTHPVGQKLSNPWGLYDMHGNVYEWCQDQEVRGGGWDIDGGRCRSAFYIGGNTPTFRSDVKGFRVVLAPSQP